MSGVAVSIVTPTLNAERYLEACLASVARQGVEVEHLLVDAGSTDRTLEMARASVGVRVIEQRGSSQTQAINVGLEQARGAVVAWLNADDMYADGA
ncbi:MAG: glycosyltransferase, partial [Chloroflexi bacterium]|nr:glycosyltransferase [Chloroflexota bacterium]